MKTVLGILYFVAFCIFAYVWKNENKNKKISDEIDELRRKYNL